MGSCLVQSVELNGSWILRSSAERVFVFLGFVLELHGARWLLDGAAVFDLEHGGQGSLDRVKGQMRSSIVSTVTTVTTVTIVRYGLRASSLDP